MSNKQRPLTRLMRYAHNYRKKTVLAVTSSILNKLFDLAPPILIGMAIDVVVSQEDSFLAQLGITDVYAQLWALAAISLFAWIMESVFEYAYAILWRNLAQNIQHDLRVDAYDHVQRLEMAYFEERNTGSLMAVLNDDINQLERFLDNGANKIIQLFTTVILIGSLFIVVIPNLAWLAMLPIPFIVWGSLWFQDKLTPRYARVREHVAILNSQLSNNLGGIATIKSFTAEDYETEHVRHESNLYQQSNQHAIKLSSAFGPLIRMLVVMGFIVILVYGGLMVINGQLNVGVYSVLVFMTQRLLWPLTDLGEILDNYQRAMASTNRVLDLLDTRPQIPEGSKTLQVETVRGELALEHVNFAYTKPHNSGVPAPSGQNGATNIPATIHNLSLHIPVGETVAIVGATGAGKSTIIKLLLRFYDVQSGRVCLDGVDIRDLRMQDLRRAIGLVSQDVFLFHGTVRENIAYGTFDAPMEQIINAAKIAEAHEFIASLPQGYDTIVGERGQKLSGGQRQRISIARAVLKDPPVLILDEATSSVDNETEAAIQRSMERIAVGRTTIVIAHRLSTVRNAHRIFVLEQGSLKEQGTHNQLVKLDGIYAALWRVQTGERSGVLP